MKRKPREHGQRRPTKTRREGHNPSIIPLLPSLPPSPPPSLGAFPSSQDEEFLTPFCLLPLTYLFFIYLCSSVPINFCYVILYLVVLPFLPPSPLPSSLPPAFLPPSPLSCLAPKTSFPPSIYYSHVPPPPSLPFPLPPLPPSLLPSPPPSSTAHDGGVDGGGVGASPSPFPPPRRASGR